MPSFFQSLSRRAFTPLPLGAVRPKGWLEKQLRIQADGLSGHLDEGFFPDLGPHSGWLGGDGPGGFVAHHLACVARCAERRGLSSVVLHPG